MTEREKRARARIIRALKLPGLNVPLKALREAMRQESRLRLVTFNPRGDYLVLCFLAAIGNPKAQEKIDDCLDSCLGGGSLA